MCWPTLACYGASNCVNVSTAVTIIMTGDVAITGADSVKAGALSDITAATVASILAPSRAKT